MRNRKIVSGAALFLLCLSLVGYEIYAGRKALPRSSPSLPAASSAPAPTATIAPELTPRPKPTPAPESSRKVYEQEMKPNPWGPPDVYQAPDLEDERTIRDMLYCPVSEYPEGDVLPLMKEVHSPDYTGPLVRQIGRFSLGGEIWENHDPNFTGEYPVPVQRAKEIAKAALLDIYAAEGYSYVKLGIENDYLLSVGRHIYYCFRSFEVLENHVAHIYKVLVSVEDGEVWLTLSDMVEMVMIEVPQPVMEEHLQGPKMPS